MVGKIFGLKKKVKIHEAPHCRIEDELLDPSKGQDSAVQSWRVFRIMSEFVQGFEMLKKYRLAATFWGSARTNPKDPIYKAAEELAAKLAKKGFTIISGGGGGVMEASNVGAFKVGGNSVGLNIELPVNEPPNPYTTDSFLFHFFFSRKVMLTFASEVYVYFPGGFGTLDEFFEIATLVKTKKISKIPIILYDKAYWEPLLRWFEKDLLKKYKTINKEDLELFYVTDDIEDAYKYILKNVNCNNIRQI